MKKVLITGGAGFVGSHLIEAILKTTDWEVVTLDRFDAAGNPNRLSEMLESTPGVDRKRVKFVFWDLKAPLNEGVKKQLGGNFDYIMHLAAGSHVDRSITDPVPFFYDNTIGTVNLLEYVKEGGLKLYAPSDYADARFLYFSTDEVFGPAPLDMEKGYSEWDRHNPNNPYAAAKSAAEMVCIAYAHTYRIPLVITNCMNIFGERQDPEKFVPLIINKVLKGEKLMIHSDKTKTQAGKRHYLHARNICSAAIWIIQHGKTLDGSAKQGRYNIVGEKEVDNLEMAKLVTEYVNEWKKTKLDQIRSISHDLILDYEMVDFHSSRPGHDLRYALDGTLLASEGFSYPVAFEESLKKMVFWTLDHGDKWL